MISLHPLPEVRRRRPPARPPVRYSKPPCSERRPQPTTRSRNERCECAHRPGAES